MTNVNTKHQLERVFKVQKGAVTIAIKDSYGDAVEVGLKYDSFQIITSQRKVERNHNKACGPFGFRYFA
ncbi:MAG: hypothetical protein WD077_09355 [Bacteroidia bacterium]